MGGEQILGPANLPMKSVGGGSYVVTVAVTTPVQRTFMPRHDRNPQRVGLRVRESMGTLVEAPR